jgi:hypothetical protein
MKRVVCMFLVACNQGMTPPPAYYPHPTNQPPNGPDAPPAPPPATAPPAAPPVADEVPIPVDKEMPKQGLSTSVTATLGASATVMVDGRADIYSSALAKPDPARAGVPVAIVGLPKGATQITFDHVAGKVGCNGGDAASPPDGGSCAGGNTDLQPASGISGVIDHKSTQFLVGVFLAGSPKTAPKSLDFTPGGKLGHDFAKLEPVIAQTFFIGDGMANGQPQIFAVPKGATVLALGIADGFSFQGAPGAYGDNVGGFKVALTVK